jgi:hypothetical protein
VSRYVIRYEKPQQRYLVLDRVRSRVVASFDRMSEAESFVLEQTGQKS